MLLLPVAVVVPVWGLCRPWTGVTWVSAPLHCDSLVLRVGVFTPLYQVALSCVPCALLLLDAPSVPLGARLVITHPSFRAEPTRVPSATFVLDSVTWVPLGRGGGSPGPTEQQAAALSDPPAPRGPSLWLMGSFSCWPCSGASGLCAWLLLSAALYSLQGAGGPDR